MLEVLQKNRLGPEEGGGEVVKKAFAAVTLAGRGRVWPWLYHVAMGFKRGLLGRVRFAN